MTDIGRSSVTTNCEWEGGRKIGVSARQFPVMYVDEPIELGGSDSAPSPEEYTLAALQSCYTTTTLLMADELGIPIESIGSETTAVMGGKVGDIGPLPEMQSVMHCVQMKVNADRSQIDRLKQLVDQSCPTYNLLKRAGVDIQASWELL